MRLTTIGRKSGQQRSVIIGYVEDGHDLVALAMNGWDEGHPSWWLNLEATPDAVVRLAGQPPRPVRARAAAGEERSRLWQRWVTVDPHLDTRAALRSTRDARSRPRTSRRDHVTPVDDGRLGPARRSDSSLEPAWADADAGVAADGDGSRRPSIAAGMKVPVTWQPAGQGARPVSWWLLGVL
jgi:deazaflavin-dependent oxidoreductase (nitroreductase family)